MNLADSARSHTSKSSASSTLVFTGAQNPRLLNPALTCKVSIGSNRQTPAPTIVCTDVGQTTAAAPQPGLWYRSNRTALCVRTASCGRSCAAAASRQAHRTASCGQTTAAVPQPGLWHRSNRTAWCVHTASCGRSGQGSGTARTAQHCASARRRVADHTQPRHRGRLIARHRGGGRSSHGSAAAHYAAAWCRHSSQRRGGHGSQDAYQTPGALSPSPEVARMT